MAPWAALLLATITLVVGACSGALAVEDAGPEAAPDPRTGSPEATPPQPSGLMVTAGPWQTDFGISDIPLSEIQPSVPRDAIPALDEPRFESLDAAGEWMAGPAPVIAIEIDSDARAYPLSILLWHEIVNDRVGGRPVLVTFCPLCHTALVYDRVLDDSEREFGNTGSLRYSDMVMHDRATGSWWQQATGEAIVGSLVSAKLTFLPSQVLSLDAFEMAYPDGIVLSRDTGHERPYGDNPFLGYGDADERPFRFDGAIDGRLYPRNRSSRSVAPSLTPSPLRSTGRCLGANSNECYTVTTSGSAGPRLRQARASGNRRRSRAAAEQSSRAGHSLFAQMDLDSTGFDR